MHNITPEGLREQCTNFMFVNLLEKQQRSSNKLEVESDERQENITDFVWREDECIELWQEVAK